jgi:hypothetical protein
MSKSRTIYLTIFAVLIVALIVFIGAGSAAQNSGRLEKPFYIQAQAMGQSTQMGRTFGVTALINEYSAPEDQKILLDAFAEKGQEGLVNALSKMPSKGRLSITGTLGGDLAYIRSFSQADGSTRIRMVTNRLLRFGEVWADTRTTDYDLSGMEVILSKDGKTNTGTLYPAARLKLTKEHQMELELYQNPWRLANIQLR